MCGIYGSNNSEKFNTLHKLNKQRGNFAFGGLGIYWDTPAKCIKMLDSDEDNDKALLFKSSKNPIFYLGHSQAPTSSVREFNEHTSHPFKDHNWVVAHNGIISNFNTLRGIYKSDTVNDVDTSIISAMLHSHNQENASETEVISAVLTELEGLYACWIYNNKTDNVYLVRCGSTLYADDKGSFSSCMLNNYNPLAEGIIYQVTNFSGLTNVGYFKYNSPYTF